MRTLRVYGVVAEFADPTALVAAAHRTREAGRFLRSVGAADVQEVPQ